MLKSKYLSYKFVNNYTVPLLIIGLAIVASTARDSSDEVRAQKLGFKDGKEFAIARENNIFNVADYAKFAEEQRVKAAEKAAHDAALASDKERKAKEDKTKQQTSTVPIDEVIPETLHQKQIFTMTEKYYKGKVYSPNETVEWIFARFLIRGDTLYYGDNYQQVATYIGSTDDGFDVYKSSNINMDYYIGEKHIKNKSHNVVYFNKSTHHLSWKMVTEDSINNDNGVRVYSGDIISTNGY